ncbi:MAG: stage II sporulation protein D [Clostridiales bacterium]|nr:stage II sporulation protein D [Clostridiales bacterium]
MKRLAGAFLFIVFITVLLPLAVVYIMGGFADEKSAKGELIEVYFHERDEVVSINSEEYLKGVVAAEMSAGFDREALKAQAVAARTYLYNHLQSNTQDEYHKGAKICTDYRHCQAWADIEAKAADWGERAKEYRDKIESAVEQTRGEVIKYNGEIISALFHSTSSGMTENAKDVWGEEIPYLVSVISEGEEASPRYESEAAFALEDYKSKISESVEGADFEKGLFSDIVRSDAGGIIELKVGGVLIRGTELRRIFGLNSTNVSLTLDSDTVKMNVKGYGHGVGMSQYGANYLAQNGMGYKDILTHYYTGVEISQK